MIPREGTGSGSGEGWRVEVGDSKPEDLSRRGTKSNGGIQGVQGEGAGKAGPLEDLEET